MQTLKVKVEFRGELFNFSGRKKLAGTIKSFYSALNRWPSYLSPTNKV